MHSSDYAAGEVPVRDAQPRTHQVAPGVLVVPRTSYAGRYPGPRMGQAVGNALIRADKRDSLRATVFACVTPLPRARCISGCAA